MSITRNRELSQFGSFIHIDDSTQSIGITTGATSFVGIGTTNPSVKFEVVGNTNIIGTLEASSYTLNGNPLTDASIEVFAFATNNVDIYRLNGNVGIGTSVFTQKLTVLGNVSAGQFISTVTSGTAPFQVLSDTLVTNLNASRVGGKTPPGGDIVGTTDAQTLTNKTLTSPVISSIVNGAFSLTVPSVNGTLVSTGSTGTVTSNMIADLNIVNADVAVGAGIVYGKLSLTNSITNTDIASGAAIAITKLASSTISGVSLGNNLNNLTFGSYLTASSSYNGSSAVSVSVAATSVNTGNTVVVRDEFGNFTGGTITATDFNSTSDINLKENIKTVENSLNTLTQLRGVSFDWKETGRSSYGVIAQELEEILPDLVKNGEVKSVNYNGIIGVLIEAVKELSEELKELKRHK
jgi:hypothetical protein